jgi:hypothetical protein
MPFDSPSFEDPNNRLLKRLILRHYGEKKTFMQVMILACSFSKEF